MRNYDPIYYKVEVLWARSFDLRANATVHRRFWARLGGGVAVAVRCRCGYGGW